jgi:Glycine transporter
LRARSRPAALSSQLARLATLITVLDAAGLGLFAVTGASKALDLGLAAAPAVILGAVTGVGGGTLRDVLLGQIPSVLRRGLYAIPALSAAAITDTAIRAGIYRPPAAAGAVLACFLIRVLGVSYDLNAPRAPDPAQRTRRSRRAKADVRSRISRGFLVPAGTLALILIIALFMMRVSRAGLSGPDPTPTGDTASADPA